MIGEINMTNDIDMTLIDDPHVSGIGLDVWGSQIEKLWLITKGFSRHSSEFKKNGVYVFPLQEDLGEELLGFFDKTLQIDFEVNDVGCNFLVTDLSEKSIVNLNKENNFYKAPSEKVQKALSNFLEEISPEIEMQLGHGWKVVNVRAWNTKPEANFGPSAWHMDGDPKYLRKIMFYPLPPNEDNGSLEFFDRKGGRSCLESKTPLCVLYDSSVLKHRGRSGKTGCRPVIEISIVPSNVSECEYIFEGQNARYLCKLPSSIVNNLTAHKYVDKRSSNSIINRFKAEIFSQRSNNGNFFVRVKRGLSRRVRALIPDNKKSLYGSHESHSVTNRIEKLNIGGGPNFFSPGWISLDGAASKVNVYPFTFTSMCDFPIPSGVVQLVYSSHCLEHLNDETVDRVLQEVKRVIASDGSLLLKLPDFELVKESFEKKDAVFFQQWGLEQLLPLWSDVGISDNLANKASMLFCGYWNKLYGDHFSRNIATDQVGSYHGPAKIKIDDVEKLLKNSSCHEIASQLVQYVKATEVDPTFNHQNAWSRSELDQLLAKNGFKLETFNKEKICSNFSDVPGILDMNDISIYCVATLVD